MPRIAATAVLGAFSVLCAVGLTSCSSATIRVYEPTPSQADSVTAFCTAFTAAGGDSRTVGPVDLSQPSDRLAIDVQQRLAVMGELVPPEQIAGAWNAYHDYFVNIEVALQDQVGGATLENDDLIQQGLDLYGQSRIVRNFALSTCPPVAASG